MINVIKKLKEHVSSQTNLFKTSKYSGKELLEEIQSIDETKTHSVDSMVELHDLYVIYMKYMDSFYYAGVIMREGYITLPHSKRTIVIQNNNMYKHYKFYMDDGFGYKIVDNKEPELIHDSNNKDLRVGDYSYEEAIKIVNIEIRDFLISTITGVATRNKRIGRPIIDLINKMENMIHAHINGTHAPRVRYYEIDTAFDIYEDMPMTYNMMVMISGLIQKHAVYINDGTASLNHDSNSDIVYCLDIDDCILNLTIYDNKCNIYIVSDQIVILDDNSIIDMRDDNIEEAIAKMNKIILRFFHRCSNDFDVLIPEVSIEEL